MFNLYFVICFLCFNSRMIIAMTTCNMNSVSPACNGFHETLVNDLVFIFFSQHKCNDFEIKTNGVSYLLSPSYALMSIVVVMYFYNR